MNEKDKTAYLDDFRNAELTKKLDMWYFALEQEALWDEILSEMSSIAQELNKGQIKSPAE
jgi:hypothetical protein